LRPMRRSGRVTRRGRGVSRQRDRVTS
jgi:hypothetical protein